MAKNQPPVKMVVPSLRRILAHMSSAAPVAMANVNVNMEKTGVIVLRIAYSLD